VKWTRTWDHGSPKLRCDRACFVFKIKQLPSAAFASAVGMWATRLRCPSEAAYPQFLPSRWSMPARHAAMGN
jgi:hypothetical protein